MKTGAAFANSAWLAASVPAWLRFRTALQHPAETQRRLLRGLLAGNAATAYGRAHGFGEIRDYGQFHARVPIVEYDDVQPWIARIMRGEHAVLTREPVTRLVPTSGSTGGRKLIPFTAAFHRELNAAIGSWMVDLCLRHPSVPRGPAYWSVSPAIADSTLEKSAVPIGFDDDSAYLGGFKQRLAENTFAVPSALRLVADLECSRYLTLLCLLRQRDLRLVSVWHPSFLALLLDALPRRWDELLADIANGGCARRDLPPAVSRAMQTSAQPARARELRGADPAKPLTLWPFLKVVSCWGDGQAALAFADLQRRLPGVVLQAKGLLATEAFVSIPLRGKHPLAVTSHFFEFADARGAVFPAEDLKRGETYSVIVTTAGGLWRYRLGDFVEVDGLVGKTPSLRFLGRGRSVSDLRGEKLAEPFVTRAIAETCAVLGFATPFAMLAPETDSAGAWSYTLFAEGTALPELTARLDAALRENPHYALCRDLGQLGPLRSFQIVSHAYETFCAVGISEGQRPGDIKPRALSSRTDWRQRFSAGHG